MGVLDVRASGAAPGAGRFEMAQITLTQGLHLGAGDTVSDSLIERFAQLADAAEQRVPANAAEQSAHELAKAGFQKKT
jgi:hypothetical protein